VRVGDVERAIAERGYLSGTSRSACSSRTRSIPRSFLTLSGFGAGRYAQEWPLALQATITLEQSYDEIDAVKDRRRGSAEPQQR
jgi:hypothetical protein